MAAVKPHGGNLRRSSLPPGDGLTRRAGLARSGEWKRAVPVLRVSVKRKAENRERRAMARRLWPDGQPPCYVPWCTALADDLHEILSRARGGSIVDEANCIPLCRPHHDQVTFTPESELGWAYELGLLRHSWDANGGAA